MSESEQLKAAASLLSATSCRKPRHISPEVSAARRERMIAMNRAPITPKESARRRAMMVALNKARALEKVQKGAQ